LVCEAPLFLFDSRVNALDNSIGLFETAPLSSHTNRATAVTQLRSCMWFFVLLGGALTAIFIHFKRTRKWCVDAHTPCHVQWGEHPRGAAGVAWGAETMRGRL
jgi:hypothetical protein